MIGCGRIGTLISIRQDGSGTRGVARVVVRPVGNDTDQLFDEKTKKSFYDNIKTILKWGHLWFRKDNVG